MTQELVKQIDEAVDRFPIRAEGVYWLHADEWDVLKDIIETLERRIAALEKDAAYLADSLEYWLPDETMIPKHHEAVWSKAKAFLDRREADAAIEEGRQESKTL